MPFWGKLIAGLTVVSIAAVYAYASFRKPNKNKRKISFSPATNGNRKSESCEKRRIIVLGLSGSGKSNIISRLCKGDKEKRNGSPTQGYNVLCIDKGHITYNIWEIGGQMKSYWTNFLEETNLLVYVVDSSSQNETMKESIKEFNQLLDDKRLKGVEVVLLANKQDVEGSKNAFVIEKEFGCQGGVVRGHKVKVLGTSAPDCGTSNSSIWEVERLLLT